MNKSKLIIAKIGGSVIDKQDDLELFLQSFAGLEGKKLLVHGGGKLADQYLKKLGIKPEMVAGRRITDLATLEVIQMVYAGNINKNIVVQLVANEISAIGLTGADADLIRAHKRPLGEIDYGYAGDIDYVNIDALHRLIENDFVPVMAPLTHNGRGQFLNTNADTIAAELAVALSKKYDVELVYCFEKPGVMTNVEDATSKLNEVNQQLYDDLKTNGSIQAGMLPKIDTAFRALRNGVSAVSIIHFAELEKYQVSELNTGTRIVR